MRYLARVKRRFMRQGWILAFLLPTLVLLVAVLVYPLVFLLWTSFHDYDVIVPQATRYVGLKNYASMLKSQRFWHSITVTLEFVVGALIVQLAFGIAIALRVSRSFRGAGVVRGILLIPMMVSPVVVAYVGKMMLDPTFGLVNYLISLFGASPGEWLSKASTALPTLVLIDSWWWTPFVVLMLVAGIASLPTSPFEAALVDGANALQTTLHITLPMLMPIILTTAILRAMGLMKVFDIVYVCTGGGPGQVTEVVNLLIYQQAFSFFRMGRSSAMSVLLVLIFGVLSMAYVRTTGVLAE